ncbi:MAG: YceI family protein [Phycisphaerales bacterium]|nr:YceI family protein [Phycisphaerales bacterium]
MKMAKSIFFLLALIMHGCSKEQQAAQPAKSESAPVSAKSGAMNLVPTNTRIHFVGTHEGPKPDPRKGGFAEFSGVVDVADNGTLRSVSFDIDTTSLWTEIPKLTAHLKSPDFFDVREHPKAGFQSTSVRPSTKTGAFDVTGKLTLLGTTKEITIPTAVSVTPQGVTLDSEFTIDRRQFGMNYGQGKVKNDVTVSVVIGEPMTEESQG